MNKRKLKYIHSQEKHDVKGIIVVCNIDVKFMIWTDFINENKGVSLTC